MIKIKIVYKNHGDTIKYVTETCHKVHNQNIVSVSQNNISQSKMTIIVQNENVMICDSFKEK